MSAIRLGVWLVTGIIISALLMQALWVIPSLTSINDLLSSQASPATKYSLLFFHDVLITLCVYLSTLLVAQLLQVKTSLTLRTRDIMVLQLPIALTCLRSMVKLMFSALPVEPEYLIYSLALNSLQAVGLVLVWLIMIRLQNVGNKPGFV